MNQQQCNELRDLLFAESFRTTPSERVFRYLAVLEGESENVDAAIYYAYAPAVWERAGVKEVPEDVLKRLLSKTPYKDVRVEWFYQDYLRDGWNLPWSRTAKEDCNDFPLLVVRERADGSVTGSLMRDPHYRDISQRVANRWCEPFEVEELIAQVRDLNEGERLIAMYKESNVEAGSLELAIAQTPETEHGQKEVLVYRDNEWLWGIWNNPAKTSWASDELRLMSVADFHGTRISEAKRDSRVGLDIARTNQTLPGGYEVLEAALDKLDGQDGDDLEQHASVRVLCDWWNAVAPEAMRTAGVFRVYYWSEDERIFQAGDPEEPARQASQLAEYSGYALFEKEGAPTVAIKFYRGRAANILNERGVQTYCVTGKEGWWMGVDTLEEVDEAYYSVRGLQSVRERIEFFGVDYELMDAPVTAEPYDSIDESICD
jgi:hypothetical protein